MQRDIFVRNQDLQSAKRDVVKISKENFNLQEENAKTRESLLLMRD